MCSLNAHSGILAEKQRGHKASFQLVVDPSVEVANVPVLQFGLGIDAVQLLVLCTQFTPHVLSHAHQLVQSLVSDPGERGGEKREEWKMLNYLLLLLLQLTLLHHKKSTN